MDDALDTYNKSDELCSSLRWSRYVLLTRSFLMVLGITPDPTTAQEKQDRAVT
jgi:hypothetical protein